MPKTFQFGKRKRHAKPRGASITKNRQPDEECSVNDATASSSTSGSTASEVCDTHDASTCRIQSKLSAHNLLDVDQQACSSGGHFMFVHTSFLSSLVSSLPCPQCFTTNLSIHESTKLGLALKYDVSCDHCCSVIWSDFNSPRGPKRFDINNRVVLSSRENGIGYNQLVSFMSHMNIPSPMHHSTFDEISRDVHEAAVDAAESAMNQAASVIKERYSSGALQSSRVSASGCPVTTVSFDGTWHKRGHSSHNGVGVAIDVDCGFVVDTHTVSNFCVVCGKGPMRGSEEYEAWYEGHKDKCQKNSDCSSNGMEVAAAEVIFDRSVESCGLIYGNMLCDGDSKAFQRVKETSGYDIDVVKLDCVNHIAKRMFNALENVKKSNKSDRNRKLTRPMIDKITNTYAKNLKINAPDVINMRNGVMGGILHMSSTNENPNHRLCPIGESSWCAYQRALALGQPTPPHKPTFKADILKFVWPIVKSLTEPELLQRCVDMQTQNANESFNTLIWKRCPKNNFGNRQRVETAVALSVIAFNCGPSGLRMVMARLGLRWEEVCHQFALRITQDKIRRAAKRTIGMSKWKRKHKKSQRIASEHAKETAEGSTYASGAYNL